MVRFYVGKSGLLNHGREAMAFLILTDRQKVPDFASLADS
jgi:hypothetical protein